MAYTEATKRATMKYISQNLEEVRFRVRKGERAALQAEAKAQGMSTAQFMIKAVNAYAGKQLLSPSSEVASRADQDGE